MKNETTWWHARKPWNLESQMEAFPASSVASPASLAAFLGASVALEIIMKLSK